MAKSAAQIHEALERVRDAADQATSDAAVMPVRREVALRCLQIEATLEVARVVAALDRTLEEALEHVWRAIANV